MIALSGVGIALALGGMAFLIFKKVSPVIVGPLAAILVCLLSRLPVVSTVLTDYVGGVAGFFSSYFFIFLLGNIFGNLYQLSGAASKIGSMISRLFGAKNCMLACLLAAAALSYGGINSFVIIFAVYPIALKLFEEADIPTYMLPGIVCGGMWTFAMTGPFTPQIPNVASMKYLGTPSWAALIPGIAASVAMALLIVLYMNRQAKKARLRGEHFVYPNHVSKTDELQKRPHGLLSFLPLVAVVVLFNVTDLGIELCLAIGIVLALACFWPNLPKKELLASLNSSAVSSVTIIINTAAIVGFGTVAKLTPFYAFAVETLEASTANPYVVAAVGSNVFAGILGSASGGITLMYTSLKDTFLNYGAQGFSLEFIHRLCAFGSGGLDSMPWNGSIVSIYQVCGVTHKQSYKYNFVTCAVIPVLCTFAVALPLCLILG